MFEKLLLPAFISPIAGAAGTIWWSTLEAYNDGPEPVLYLPVGCPSSGDSCLPLSSLQGIGVGISEEACISRSSSGNYPGLFLWLERDKLRQIRLSLRLFNRATEATGGTQLPVVRETDTFHEAFVLLGLPTNDPSTRIALRIFDFDSPARSEVLLRFFDDCAPEPVPRLERIVVMENASSPSSYLPTQITLDLRADPAAVVTPSLRIEISPVGGDGAKLWAFATATATDGTVSVFLPLGSTNSDASSGHSPTAYGKH